RERQSGPQTGRTGDEISFRTIQFRLGGYDATLTCRLACVWHGRRCDSDVGALRCFTNFERTSLSNSMNGIASRVTTYALGGLVGGLAGGAFVVVVTLALKAMMDFVSSQVTWVLIVAPLIGLALTVLLLQVYATSDSARPARNWRTFPRGAIQADITGDVVDSAGEEERFPWRLTPIHTLAIFATVGLGAGMGTEAPAAYFGVAAGAFVGDRGRWWRRLVRPAALG